MSERTRYFWHAKDDTALAEHFGRNDRIVGIVNDVRTNYRINDERICGECCKFCAGSVPRLANHSGDDLWFYYQLIKQRIEASTE